MINHNHYALIALINSKKATKECETTAPIIQHTSHMLPELYQLPKKWLENYHQIQEKSKGLTQAQWEEHTQEALKLGYATLYKESQKTCIERKWKKLVKKATPKNEQERLAIQALIVYVATMRGLYDDEVKMSYIETCYKGDAAAFFKMRRSLFLLRQDVDQQIMRYTQPAAFKTLCKVFTPYDKKMRKQETFALAELIEMLGGTTPSQKKITKEDLIKQLATQPQPLKQKRVRKALQAFAMQPEKPTVVLFGGHKNYQQRLQQVLPQLEVGDAYRAADFQQLLHKDYVITIGLQAPLTLRVKKQLAKQQHDVTWLALARQQSPASVMALLQRHGYE